MADKKISALTAASTPLDGTEVLPIVQSGATVKVANNDLRPKQIQSNATSGVLQVVGPAAAATRVMTVPDANFTAARTDAAQTFTGNQTFSNNIIVTGVVRSGTMGANNGDYTLAATDVSVTFYALGATATLTLPAASSNTGRAVWVRTQSNQAINSASSNITALANGSVTNSILSNTAGKWALLMSDGSYWNIIAAN